MKARVLFLTTALVIGAAASLAATFWGPGAVQQTPLPEESVSLPSQQEPVGWVFGRLIGIQPSVYSPSGVP